MKVLVIEPIRYWVFSSGACPSIMLRPPLHTRWPLRTTAPTKEGVRPCACPTARRCSRARRVSGSNSLTVRAGVGSSSARTSLIGNSSDLYVI